MLINELEIVDASFLMFSYFSIGIQTRPILFSYKHKDVLSLFLNFAALGFLQSIDDVAFGLVANGYMGNRMESRADLVSNTTLPVRVGDGFTNSLDTILFFATMLMMYMIFAYLVLIEYGIL